MEIGLREKEETGERREGDRRLKGEGKSYGGFCGDSERREEKRKFLALRKGYGGFCGD